MKAIVLIIGLAACGGSSNPLVGSWNYLGTPAGTTEVYTYSSDGTFMAVANMNNSSNGCSNTITVNGTWQTSGTTLTSSSTAQTIATSGCTGAAASNNMATHPDPNFQPTTNTFTYVVNGNMLTLTNSQGSIINFSKQ